MTRAMQVKETENPKGKSSSVSKTSKNSKSSKDQNFQTRYFTAPRKAKAKLFVEKVTRDPTLYGGFCTPEWYKGLLKAINEPEQITIANVKHWVSKNRSFFWIIKSRPQIGSKTTRNSNLLMESEDSLDELFTKIPTKSKKVSNNKPVKEESSSSEDSFSDLFKKVKIKRRLRSKQKVEANEIKDDTDSKDSIFEEVKIPSKRGRKPRIPKDDPNSTKIGQKRSLATNASTQAPKKSKLEIPQITESEIKEISKDEKSENSLDKNNVQPTKTDSSLAVPSICDIEEIQSIDLISIPSVPPHIETEQVTSTEEHNKEDNLIHETDLISQETPYSEDYFEIDDFMNSFHVAYSVEIENRHLEEYQTDSGIVMSDEIMLLPEFGSSEVKSQKLVVNAEDFLQLAKSSSDFELVQKNGPDTPMKFAFTIKKGLAVRDDDERVEKLRDNLEKYGNVMCKYDQLVIAFEQWHGFIIEPRNIVVYQLFTSLKEKFQELEDQLIEYVTNIKIPP